MTDGLENIAADTDIEKEVERRELLDRIYAVMNATLTIEERQIIFGTIFDGLTANELAEALGITADNVRQKKARALKKVRDIIDRENG